MELRIQILSQLFSCPVDGEFADWGTWATCSVSCASGTSTRIRTCTNPEPQNGGAFCTGDISETTACDEGPCPGKYVLFVTYRKQARALEP